MPDITFGSPNIFLENPTMYTGIGALDPTHFVVAYKDTNAGGFGTAVIAETNGATTISSYGDVVVFSSANTEYISVGIIDPTHFATAFKDRGDLNHGKAVIGETDGDTAITSYGTIVEFNPAMTEDKSLGILDATHFVIAYKDAGDGGHAKAVIGETDGDTAITSYGAVVEFNAASTDAISLAILDATHFVISYRDVGDAGHGKAVIGETDGDTAITSYGAVVEFNAASTDFTSIAILDATHFVISYRDAGDAGHGKAVIGETDGDTAITSYGAVVEFNAASTNATSIGILDATHFVIAYTDAGDLSHGKALIGETDGDTAITSYGAVAEFRNISTSHLSLAILDATHFAVSYREGGFGYGEAVVGQIPSAGFAGKVLGVSAPAKVIGVSTPLKVIGVE